MSKHRCIPGILVGIILLVQGCATVPAYKVISNKMTACLDSCIGKLTEDQLVMKASTPSERVQVEDGEIWIYKYRKSEVNTTTTGTGGLLFPLETQSTTSDYALDVRLRFNSEKVLSSWSYSGNVAAFNHPFGDLQCN